MPRPSDYAKAIRLCQGHHIVPRPSDCAKAIRLCQDHEVVPRPLGCAKAIRLCNGQLAVQRPPVPMPAVCTRVLVVAAIHHLTYPEDYRRYNRSNKLFFFLRIYLSNRRLSQGNSCQLSAMKVHQQMDIVTLMHTCPLQKYNHLDSQQILRDKSDS